MSNTFVTVFIKITDIPGFKSQTSPQLSPHPQSGVGNVSDQLDNKNTTVYCLLMFIRDSTLSQSPQSPATTLTRSQSPEYWSPAPAACNQALHIYTLHSDTHRPVYRSPTWTSLTNAILTFMCFPSDPPDFLRFLLLKFLCDPDPPAKTDRYFSHPI